ncbi:MAG: ABC transporter ATP-binding protein/permease [Alphaproteobacteria bacterium]|nr:ABC transporter ATP-binding protein/permease [Alphaproteobacteria bacterium]MBO6628688.1 ABC transporter ATP-binding protein/permease [Alphaproteobacteria bacterium]
MHTSGDTPAQMGLPTPTKSTFRSVLPLLWPEGRRDLRARVVLAFLAMIGAKVFTVYAPFFFRDAVDVLTGQDPAVSFVVVPVALVASYGLARVMMIALAQLRDGIFARVGQNAVRVLAITAFRHIHALSLRFHLERRTGGLSRIIERGTKAIEFLLRFSLFSIVPTIIELLLVAGILWWNFDWRYAAVTVVMISIYIGFTYWATEWRTAIRREMNDKDTDANTKAIDSLLNYETVKYFGNEAHEARRYDRAMQGYEDAAIRTSTSLSVLNTGQTLIFTVGLIALMLMAAYGVAAGALSVGEFVMVNAFMIQLSAPLNLLGSVYREIRQALVDMETMFGLIAVPPEVTDRPNAKDLKVNGGAIRFENVSFAYDPARGILKNVSFDVPAGKSVALVGPSGAGKSTISRILYRFYDVQAGTVTIDGQDIAEITQSSLRGAIGIVPQDTVLFNDTIRYNIRYGRPDATEAEIEEAARMAQISDFIARLPKGFDTMVGERGLKLSGGEKQRVAIARTILKNPPILMLDEATSALDSATERDIQAALRQISANRTSLIIAHRLSTVVDADEILVLNHGEIVERGTHAALLARGGMYAEMWNRQQEEAAENSEKGGQSTQAPRLEAADSAHTEY